MVQKILFIFFFSTILNLAVAEEGPIQAPLKYQAIPDKVYIAAIEKITEQGIKITKIESRDVEGVLAKGPLSHSLYVSGYNSENESISMECESMAVLKRPKDGEKASVSRILVSCKDDE